MYGFDAVAPYSGDTFDLVSGEQIKAGQRQRIDAHKKSVKASKNVFAKLLAAAERLMLVIKQSEGLPNKELSKFTDQINELCNKWKR